MRDLNAEGGENRRDITIEPIGRPAPLIDPDKLRDYTLAAIQGQSDAQTQEALIDAVRRGDRFDVSPRDADGYHTVSVGGRDLVRLHFTRLLPGGPEQAN